MLADVVDYLACPHCASGLSLDAGALRCARGHPFDVARQGYVSLLHAEARGDTGDTAEMVGARDAFLGRRHYAPLARRVAADCAVACSAADGCVVDVGCGTGYYLAAVLDAAPPQRVGLALDSSRYAVRRAARVHRRVGAVRCDVWRPLPVRPGVAAVALSVFAPREPAEIARIVAPGGSLVVVVPTAAHLRELVDGLGLLTVPAGKQDRVAAQLRPWFARAEHRPLEYAAALAPADVQAVVAMGPSAWHLDGDRVRRVLAGWAEPVDVTVSVTVTRYRRTRRFSQ